MFRNKVSVADIANAALAGGVSIGSTCDHASSVTAFVIGILAGALSTIGFAVIQERLQAMLKKDGYLRRAVSAWLSRASGRALRSVRCEGNPLRRADQRYFGDGFHRVDRRIDCRENRVAGSIAAFSL